MRVGAYEIVARLGAGAMGDVYRARDTRLGRDVAIKVLPQSLAGDPERLTRFEREARSLAALNHPNIAHIYGVEDATSGSALVMELVPGRDLRERMNAGPMPLSEAVPIAQQIAAGLEAAHEAGIIHRDLKPANIRVRDDGVVKVLDFGLAKALSSSSTAVVDQQSIATVTSPHVTRQGIVLGTAAYMSPEQARGRDVDKRSDIWAFGVVLYEMLSGRRLFADETLSDTIAAVLTRSIDLTLLPATTPPHVRGLIARCLERDAKRRLRDIGEARIILETAAEGSTDSTGVASPARATHSTSPVWRTFAMIAAGIVMGAAAVLLWKPVEPPTPSTRLQFDLSPPPGTTLRLSSRPAMAISADGSSIALAAAKDGVSRIYMRRLDDVEMKAIPGTEGMSDPAFSPDGAWLTAVTEGAITKFRTDGNASVQLTVTARASRGTAWLGNDAVVFGVPAGLGLQIVSAMGGAARPLTELDRTRGERTHRWPAAVPGDKALHRWHCGEPRRLQRLPGRCGHRGHGRTAKGAGRREHGPLHVGRPAGLRETGSAVRHRV